MMSDDLILSRGHETRRPYAQSPLLRPRARLLHVSGDFLLRDVEFPEELGDLAGGQVDRAHFGVPDRVVEDVLRELVGLPPHGGRHHFYAGAVGEDDGHPAQERVDSFLHLCGGPDCERNGSRCSQRPKATGRPHASDPPRKDRLDGTRFTECDE